MRTAALGLVMLLGCSGGAEIGGACSLDDPCDDGAVCDLSSGMPPTCIAADGDLDGDGLRNDKDYCHAAPGGEFDEDGDQVGNDCDRCPIAAPLATPDADGDLVDAPCDPDTSTPGDRIVLFDGFNAAVPPTWKSTGTWELRGGEIVGTPPDPTTVATLTGPLPLTTTKVAVLGSYRIDSVDGAATTSYVGVTATDNRPAGVTTISCGGQRAGGMDSLLLDTDLGAAPKAFMNLFDTASRYRVAEKLEGASAACSMIADEEQGAVQQNTGGNPPSQAGAFVRGATARFQYILVVQRSP